MRRLFCLTAAISVAGSFAGMTATTSQNPATQVRFTRPTVNHPVAFDLFSGLFHPTVTTVAPTPATAAPVPAPPVPAPVTPTVVVAKVVVAPRARAAPTPVASHVAAAPPTASGLWACIGAHESGNNPTTNTGNGYYGAFQFSASTWNSMHTGYTRADLAPYSVQMAAAQAAAARGGLHNQFPSSSRACGG